MIIKMHKLIMEHFVLSAMIKHELELYELNA